jgi:ankyrin repeat protein
MGPRTGRHCSKLGGVSLLSAASDGHEISDCLLTITFILRLMTSRCSNVLSFTQDGNTALHNAVWFGHPSIVRMLLAAEADTNSTNKVSEAPPRLLPSPSTVGPQTLCRQGHAAAAEQQACLCAMRAEQGGICLCSVRRMTFTYVSCCASFKTRSRVPPVI